MYKGYVYILIVLFLVLACEQDSCLHGAGENSSKEISFSPIHSLKVCGIFHVTLVYDSVNYIRFEGGEKMLRHVDAGQEGNSLTLSNTNNCLAMQNYSDVRAYVHSTTLTEVHLHESCLLDNLDTLYQGLFVTVQADMAEVDLTVHTPSLWYYNNRTTGGIYTFQGYAEWCDIAAFYTGQFNLGQLRFRRGKINNASLSDIYINPIDQVVIQIHNQGDIYYRGTSDIVIDTITGGGELLAWE